MHCPECGSLKVQSFGKRHWFYPFVFVAVFPISFAQLHQASCPFEYRCRDCGLYFERRTTPGRIALFILILVLVGIPALAALGALLSITPR
jgi:hypothetical protein